MTASGCMRAKLSPRSSLQLNATGKENLLYSFRGVPDGENPTYENMVSTAAILDGATPGPVALHIGNEPYAVEVRPWHQDLMQLGALLIENPARVLAGTRQGLCL